MARSLVGHTFALSALLSVASAGTYVSFASSGLTSCPADSPLSCQNSTAVQDICCFNSPGGQLLQTQFWDTNPATGPEDSWTIHGLWPDHCDGTFDATCDSSRAYTNISDILSAGGADDTLSYMKTYWKDYQGQDEQFWEHEWGKHGTCISTIDPSCYTDYQPTEEAVDFFKKTVELFKTLPSYQWLSEAGITPSASATYSSADIQSALKAKHGKEVTIGCKNGALDEIWYHYNVQGSIIGGNFVAADPDGTKSTCPDTGVKYLPKSGGSSGGGGGSSTSTTSTSGSSPTGTPFSGKGQLKVYSGSSQTGCIISSGSWFTTGTCASFTAAASGNGFTLSSSKGKCGVSGEALTCGSGVTATVFTTSGGNLAYNGSTKFYADAAPTGSTQATVHTGSGKVELSIVWG